MQHMPLFQIELFIMRIPGRSNISRKFFENFLSNCFANQENEKKNNHYSVWLIVLDYSKNLGRKIRKIWIELHHYFYMK